MSAKVSVTKAMAIAARTVRAALKPELRTQAERRGLTDVKVSKVENGKSSEPKALGN